MPRILVIDDEEMVRYAVAMILQSEGWETVQAADGQEGLAKARQTPPDIIVCDLNMPVMDGFEVLTAVRSDPTLQAVPFLVITGQTGHGYEKRALETGAEAVLLKPFHNNTLVDLVRRHLGGGKAAANPEGQKPEVSDSNPQCQIPNPQSSIPGIWD